MRHITTILLLVIFCYGCSGPEHKVQFEPGRTIAYVTPYTGWNSSAVRFNLANGQEAIAFFNTETYKRMDVFTLDGKRVKTIPLKELLKEAHYIVDIAALNRDSFLALGEYHNNVYLFNSEGKVLRQTHINDKAPGNNPNWYTELSANKCDGFIQDNSTLLLRCVYYERELNKNRSKAEHMLFWDSINHTLPYFLAVRDAFKQQPQLQYALPGFYNRFLPDSCTTSESNNYVITPYNILLSSWYNDSLYILNKQSYEIEKAIKIQSAYTKIGITVRIDSSAVLNDKLQTEGSIQGLFYDKYRGLYYVSIRHAIPRSATIEERRNHRKWSLLVYDKNFKQLDEINMDPKFLCDDIVITREGIMLEFYDYKKSNVPTQFQLFYVHQK